MNTIAESVRIGQAQVPAIIFEHHRPRAQAVVVHGYGGCKEEILGLAWRIAKEGFSVASIDLRGHGENKRSYDMEILDDVEDVVGQFKKSGKVVAIGHSLGGRLCLLSKADCKIAISPAPQTVSQATQNLITSMRSHRVREEHEGTNFDALKRLPQWDGVDGQQAMILYAARDVPEISSECTKLEKQGIHVEQVENSVHSDIFLNEGTFLAIQQQLKRWFPLP